MSNGQDNKCSIKRVWALGGALTACRTPAVSRIVDKGNILDLMGFQPFRDMDENGLFALTLEPHIVTL